MIKDLTSLNQSRNLSPKEIPQINQDKLLQLRNT